MKNQENKNTGIQSTAPKDTNHHANPSRMNPEVAAMLPKEQPGKKKSASHGLLYPDKGADVERIHTNGSTTSDRL